MKYGVLLLSLLLVVVSCDALKEEPSNEQPSTYKVSETLVTPSVSDTSFTFDLGEFKASVRIKMPKSTFKGTILVLQGWNFPNTSWSDSSNLEQLASEAGFALLMPGMGKSIYHKRVYDQTRKDWQKYPTRTWLVDTLLTELRSSYGLFTEGANNFVMGLSTGGRGALIIAQENPDIFVSGCSLSGDYDQDAFPGDNLYRGYFGVDSKNWSDDENPVSFVSEWSVPMYVAHGAADSIVPIAHHNRLEEVVSTAGISKDRWVFKTDASAGHNYSFWASEVEAILEYFKSFT